MTTPAAPLLPPYLSAAIDRLELTVERSILPTNAEIAAVCWADRNKARLALEIAIARLYQRVEP